MSESIKHLIVTLCVLHVSINTSNKELKTENVFNYGIIVRQDATINCLIKFQIETKTLA